MGKFSSSTRKKHSRSRSKSRTMKKRKSSKSHRDKSKKLRRRHDYVSFSDDNNSRSLASVSPSDSENEYVSRKSRSRSRTRKDAKRSKKRSQKRSLSSDSSSPSPARKKKASRSSRKGDKHGRRKRNSSKKKSRRDVSVSTASSESESGSESDEGEFERRRRKSERKGIHEIKSEDVKTESRSRDSSIASSRGRYSECSKYQSEEEIVVEQTTSRRLKSVVTVVKAENEERDLESAEHKEEIISDHDAYPSSKSNDSNDGLIRKEFFQHLGIASETRNRDDDKGENTGVSNVRTGSILSGNNGISSSDLISKNDDEEKRENEASGSAGNVGGEDLETILRQQAMENLRKFRGGSHTNVKSLGIQKGTNDATVEILSKEDTKSVELKSTREYGSNAITASQASQQGKLPATRNGSTGLPHDGKIAEASDGDKGSQIAELDVASAGNNVASTPSPKEKVNIAINSESIKQRGSSRESLNTSTDLKQGLLSKEHSQTVLVSRSKGKVSAAEPARSVEPKSDNNDGNKIKGVHDSTRDEPSGPGSMSADVGSGNSQDGTKEGSEFEQRTMTVMRGGELVQVSYKVKIPKRTPALARRQFKR